MATITTRSGKGSPLTSTEVDENFTNLNSDKLEASSYTAADILSKVTSVDGTGSGLDADMLDGQEGSYYLNTATNFGGDVSGTYDSLVVADDSHDHVIANVDGLQTALDGKQDTLVSGTSIKTVNSQSILGSGNIQIDGGVTSFNTRTGAVSLTSTDVTDALTFTPISASDNAATATALQTARSINGTSFNGTADITVTASTTNTLTRGTYLTGSNFDGSAATTWDVDATSGNTASKVVARDASGDFSAGTITAALSGNATTATTLQTARTINGSSFNGSANITVPVNTSQKSDSVAYQIPFVSSVTAGNQNLYTDSAANITYNPSTNTLTTTTFSGALSGNATTATTASSCSGNAATATTLQTARTINGVSFDGSANITVADSTKLPLTGGTLDNGVDTTLTLLSDDTGASTLNLYGNSQGTGRVYVGQSTSYGGGIEYNGDGSPSTTGAGADYITLWRRSNSVDSWTARNSQSNNDWEFRGSVMSPIFYGGAAGFFTGNTLSVGTNSPTANIEAYNSYYPDLRVRSNYSNILIGGYYGNATIRDTTKTNSPGINFTANAVLPAGGSSSLNPADNLLDLGNASYRWDDIYATNTVIQTSDRNYKQDIEELSEAEKRVALVAKTLMRKYRWKDAVEKKGDDARIHYGIIAQDLKAAFENEGLDAHRYAMFTWNEWWEGDRVIPAVEAQEAVYETQIDEEGNETQVCVSEAIEAHEEVSYPDVFYTEAEAPANAIRKERMGIRYNELLSFIIAALPGS